MEQKHLFELSSQIGQILTARGLTVCTAESCTGGLLGHVLTGVSGSSAYYVGGVIAYSNAVKETLLGVRSETLLQFGAVSHPTAREMAAGVRERLGGDLGLSTTGIAGPTGGTPEKPVGLVYIGVSTQAQTESFECHFEGSREEVKEGTVNKLLSVLLDHLTQSKNN